MTNLLDGKRALVTGCRGRLGPFWCTALELHGAKVYGTDLHEADITNPSDVDRLVEKHWDIDILVNNAGVDSRPGDAGELEQAMLAVNVQGTQLMIEKFAAHARRLSSIVNIASLYGLVAPDLRYYSHRPDGWVKDAMYPATKAAIVALTRYYGASLAPRIRVNALAPGGVVAGADGLTVQDPAFVQKYVARIPMGRMAKPADLEGPLVFLASDLSSFITGHTLPIDGGYLAW